MVFIFQWAKRYKTHIHSEAANDKCHVVNKAEKGRQRVTREEGCYFIKIQGVRKGFLDKTIIKQRPKGREGAMW